MNDLSPVPHKVKVMEMTFPDAIKEVIDGKRITKREWDNNNVYGMLRDGFLMLHKEDGKFYQWILNDGDLKGEDWVVLSDAN